MPWFFSRKKSPTHPAGPQQTPEGSVTLPHLTGERRYLNTVPYMLPKDLEEINRLDFQHYVLRASLKSNHLAPLENPRSILDVGCGTGQWCYELCAEFPQAQVIGFDLEAGKQAAVPNFQFVAGNVLEGLPFADESFDYVHQRLLVTALPLTAWLVEVRDLVRVTHSGGWIELVEGGSEIAPSGPATRRIFELTSQMAAIRGLDTSGVVARSLGEYLRQAGVQHVESGFLDIPIGQWGGRIGAMMAINFRTTFSGLGEPFQARFHLAKAEFESLLTTMQQEWERYHTLYRFHYAYGQKTS